AGSSAPGYQRCAFSNVMVAMMCRSLRRQVRAGRSVVNGLVKYRGPPPGSSWRAPGSCVRWQQAEVQGSAGEQELMVTVEGKRGRGEVHRAAESVSAVEGE